MKVIIAGGRDYVPKQIDIERLDKIDITEVVSGGAPGADYFGEVYAGIRGLIPVKKFPADWKNYGRAAGPVRW